MNFHVLTLFPEMIEQGVGTSITGRAIKQHKISLDTVNIRDFSQDKHRRVDDYTYGGGAGMLMQPQPVYDAWKHVMDGIETDRRSEGLSLTPDQQRAAGIRTIYVTPQGLPFTQRMAEEFAESSDLIFVCGHYEGIDERVLEETVTDYVSIGDYVLTGGELAAMVMIDAISRLVPGVLHNEVSADTESFHGSLLEYPQYSRPEEWHGRRVPEVLLSGNPRQVDSWRLEQSIARTKERRPDLYREYQRLESFRKELFKQKLLHMDMINVISRGKAGLLNTKALFLRDTETGVFYYSSINIEETQKQQAIEEALTILGQKQSPGKEYRIVCHDQRDAREFALALERTAAPRQQMVLTRREKLPVTGLYRPDGKPTKQGLVILPALAPAGEMAFEACLRKREEGPETDSGSRISGEFTEITAAYGKVTKDGFLELFVKPEYRRRHIGMALETCMCNALLELGKTPVLLVNGEDAAMIALQEKLGLYAAKTPVYLL